MFPIPAGELAWLIAELSFLRKHLLDLEAHSGKRLARVAPQHAASARNLVHYLALRRHDIRHLQERLSALGLSSLGRAEGWVLRNLESVLRILLELNREKWSSEPDGKAAPAFKDVAHELDRKTEALLGPRPQHRPVRILVTMPGEAATNPELVRDLLANGMDCMRINCAHDGPEVWKPILDHLHRAEAELGCRCRVLMDLGGPKLRTGEIQPGPAVIRWKPQRDLLGRVVHPASIWLTDPENPHPTDGASVRVPVPVAWLRTLEVGERIQLMDTRGRVRILKVVQVAEASVRAESMRTAYVQPGTILRVRTEQGQPVREACVGALPLLPQTISLQRGDRLLLTRDPSPGRPAQDGRPARVPCTLPEVFTDLNSGERIFLDDGKIEGVLREVGPDEVMVEITRTRKGGAKLGADKGINLPDSTLRLPALTIQDLDDLRFVVKHADLVGLSFVHNADDVKLLQNHLRELGGEHLGIILKIETRTGFEGLPQLLLQAMAGPAVGVMIARGDLAVECGWERMAEIQEEILWVCEAAHVPVIWATQVLESLAKDGFPSRAEITDAAMGERAECVMLNKGPHIVDAVRTLDEILRRMQDHQHKKRSMMRRLKLAQLYRPT